MGARELLADLTGEGLSVTAAGDRLVIRPASKLTDDMRAALREAKPALLVLLAAQSDLSAVAWTDADIAHFTDRRARLLRWGYATVDADALAERLTRRDRSGDDRVNCTECASYRPGRCGNHGAALLHSHELGRDLAGLLQRCPGFQF